MLSKDNIHSTLHKGGQHPFFSLAIVVAGLILVPAVLFSREDGLPETTTRPDAGNSPAAAVHNAEESSRARAVTVADVIGTVKIKRPGAAHEDPMAVNTPVQAGFQISTSADSTAGVALEHESTAIVGEHSRVLFHQLALDANGNRLTGMTLEAGLATLHFLPQRHSAASKDPHLDTAAALNSSLHGDIFEVRIAEAMVTVVGKCRFRVDVKGGYVRVEVFKGDLVFATPLQSVELAAGQSVEHRLGGRETAFDIHRGIVKDPWDGWVPAEEQKVLSTAKDDAKNRKPEDLDAILKLRRSYPSTRIGNATPPPRPRRY